MQEYYYAQRSNLFECLPLHTNLGGGIPALIFIRNFYVPTYTTYPTYKKIRRRSMKIFFQLQFNRGMYTQTNINSISNIQWPVAKIYAFSINYLQKAWLKIRNGPLNIGNVIHVGCQLPPKISTHAKPSSKQISTIIVLYSRKYQP